MIAQRRSAFDNIAVDVDARLTDEDAHYSDVESPELTESSRDEANEAEDAVQKPSIVPSVCSACTGPLRERGLRLMTDDGNYRLFHRECMKCYVCSELYTPINPLGVAEDMRIYCKKDYERLIAKKEEIEESTRSDKSVTRMLKKHGRWGTPKLIKVVINASRGLIDWKGTTLHLRDLQKILRGKKTKAFERTTAADVPASHCISLQFHQRIVNFECSSREQREEILRIVRDATLVHMERLGKKAFFQKSRKGAGGSEAPTDTDADDGESRYSTTTGNSMRH